MTYKDNDIHVKSSIFTTEKKLSVSCCFMYLSVYFLINLYVFVTCVQKSKDFQKNRLIGGLSVWWLRCWFSRWWACWPTWRWKVKIQDPTIITNTCINIPTFKLGVGRNCLGYLGLVFSFINCYCYYNLYTLSCVSVYNFSVS